MTFIFIKLVYILSNWWIYHWNWAMVSFIVLIWKKIQNSVSNVSQLKSQGPKWHKSQTIGVISVINPNVFLTIPTAQLLIHIEKIIIIKFKLLLLLLLSAMKYGYFEKNIIPVTDTYRYMITLIVLLHTYWIHETSTKIFSSLFLTYLDVLSI